MPQVVVQLFGFRSAIVRRRRFTVVGRSMKDRPLRVCCVAPKHTNTVRSQREARELILWTTRWWAIDDMIAENKIYKRRPTPANGKKKNGRLMQRSNMVRNVHDAPLVGVRGPQRTCALRTPLRSVTNAANICDDWWYGGSLLHWREQYHCHNNNNIVNLFLGGHHFWD